MARKKKETTKVEKIENNVELEALVNEGKNIDNVKVAEVIAENKKVEEDPIREAIDEAKEAEANYIVESVLSEVKEEEGTITFDEVEGDDPYPAEECENIDDVIEECTGTIEPVTEESDKEEDAKPQTEEVKEEPKKVSEPWFIARVRRSRDYYNW